MGNEENQPQTQVGNIDKSRGIAVGKGATAVHIDALGDVGDVITGTKISLVNQAAAERVASRRQIAAPSDDYIDRPTVEAELNALLTAERNGSHIIYLYGLPGVGKSWLARKVAKELEDTFKEGTLWANLERTKLRSAVWHFIEPYDNNINRNSLRSNSEYVAAMEEAFGEQRILIVLDQIDNNRNGLKDWLPDKCTNCVFLLITQQPPPVLQSDESSYQLSGMTADEASQMFTHLLQRSDGSQAYDDASLQELANKLDYIPAAINTVARDITVKLMTPDDYLQELASRREDGSVHAHLPGLKTVYENLPNDGKLLFPFLGILQSVPWTPDDLHAISRKSNREIEVGLVQLARAGLVDKRPSGHYHTPTTISNFAFDRLKELGGQQLVDATTVLRASDILQKADLVLRYMRQSMLKECWRDEDNQTLLMSSVAKQFSNHLPAISQDSEETSVLAILQDPLLDFFENLVFKKQAYIDRWLDLLSMANFSILRHQLEETFNWALEQEDWPLLRKFATNISVNTEWIVDAQFIGDEEEYNWMQFNFNFPLLKEVVVEYYELIDIALKAPNIKFTSWRDCRFVATKWPGAYVLSSTFVGIDMVGMVMLGGVVTDCEFVDVDARYGDFRGTIFQKCTFQHVSFLGAKLRKAKFIDCYFKDVDMRLTVLEEAFENA